MKGFPTKEQVNRIKENFPIGTVIKLTSTMEDKYRPVPSGTIGEVTGVDDIGSVMVKWQNGQGLNLLPYQDYYEILVKGSDLLSEKDVIKANDDADFTDKFVIVEPSKLTPEHRNAKNQLWVVSHGPGATRVDSKTGTVHLTHPIDGDKMCVHRSEIIGVAKQEVIDEHLGRQEQSEDFGMKMT